MRILLKGYFGYGNLGDDILMLVSFNLLKEKYPKADISIFSNNSTNNKDALTTNGYNLYIRKLLSSNVQIIDWTFKGEFDLVFHGGGGTYFDKSYSLTARLLNPLLRLISLKTISSLDKIIRGVIRKQHHISTNKRIGMGIGIGNYNIGAKQLFYDLVELGTFDRLVVRDDFSYQFLVKHKMCTLNFSKNTDLAFINSWNSFPSKKRKKIKKIGIIVKGNLSFELQKILINFYEKKNNLGFDATFLSFDEIYDKQFEKKCQNFNYCAYNPLKIDLFLKSLYSLDAIITSRAHGAILGASFGIPSIILNTEIKLKEVATMFLQGCLFVDEINIANIENKFQYLESNYEAILSNLELEVKRNQMLATKLTF